MSCLLLSRILLISFCFLLSNSLLANSNWVGALAPEFKLQDQNGDWHQLKDFKEQWLILYFYPKDDTPGCTKEAKNFREHYQKFKKLNAEIVGISLDDVSSHKDFAEAYQLPFPLLADTQHQASEAYQVMGGIGFMDYAKRETFIIDPQGNIVYHYSQVVPETHAKQVLQQLKQLQKELAI